MDTYILKYTHGDMIEKIYERDNHKCTVCFTNKDLVIDHIIPVRRKGKSTLENQRILCRSCHSKITNTKSKESLSKIGLYLREWRKRNPTYLKEYHRLWRDKNPGDIYRKDNKYPFYKQSL